MSKKALFKAYDINPSNELVLNSLIAYYFHTCDYVKFFKVLQVLQKLDHTNTHLISVLTIFTAQIALV
jgi:hypothetical protein